MSKRGANDASRLTARKCLESMRTGLQDRRVAENPRGGDDPVGPTRTPSDITLRHSTT